MFDLTRSLRSLRSGELMVLRPTGRAGSASAVLFTAPSGVVLRTPAAGAEGSGKVLV